MEPTPKTVEAYRQANGICPFKEWRRSISDYKTRALIDNRIDRAALGNLGDCKPAGNGVHELRIDYGPGYRVYFSIEEERILLLLIGGDKSSQKKDILTARRYLKDYYNQLRNAKELSP